MVIFNAKAPSLHKAAEFFAAIWPQSGQISITVGKTHGKKSCHGVSAGACAASVTSRNLLKNEFFFTSVDTI
jgi:hypothetical protein